MSPDRCTCGGATTRWCTRTSNRNGNARCLHYRDLSCDRFTFSPDEKGHDRLCNHRISERKTEMFHGSRMTRLKCLVGPMSFGKSLHLANTTPRSGIYSRDLAIVSIGHARKEVDPTLRLTRVKCGKQSIIIGRNTPEGHIPAGTSYSPGKQSPLQKAYCLEPTQNAEDWYQVAKTTFVWTTFMNISRIDATSIQSEGKGTFADRSDDQVRNAKFMANLESLAHHHVVPQMFTWCPPSTFDKRSRYRFEALELITLDLKHVVSRRFLCSDYRKY